MWGCNFLPFSGGGWGGGFFPGGILPLLMWGLILTLLVYGVVKLVRPNTRASIGSSMDRDDSMSILKTRYARGELSREEFEKMKQVLAR
jgi:putative membrane protein